MKLPVVVRPEALADLLVARDWYDRQKEGRGDLFSAQATAVLVKWARILDCLK